MCETKSKILFFGGKPDTITFDDESSFADRFSSFALVLHSFRCFLVFHYNNIARDDIAKNFVQRGFSGKKKDLALYLTQYQDNFNIFVIKISAIITTIITAVVFYYNYYQYLMLIICYSWYDMHYVLAIDIFITFFVCV